ncbi:MAG: carbohydrate kinase [Clostridia bacterium]
MKRDVFAMGELLIDFMSTDRDTDLLNAKSFIKKAGGAPPNALAALSKLGGNAVIASKVGNDPFGDFLVNECRKYGMDTRMIIKDPKYSTTLAFVSLTADGERDFTFVRGADEHLAFKELDQDIIGKCRIFHFGAATGLLGGETYDTYMKMLDIAIKKDAYIVFDPNYRQDFWKERASVFRKRCRRLIEASDIVKVSDEELRIITKKKTLKAGARALLDMGARLVCVTLGKKGAFAARKNYQRIIPGIKVSCIDSTGAGDAFIGALLYRLSTADDMESIYKDDRILEEYVRYANIAGAVCCTRLGAMEGMPTASDMEIYKP